MAISMKTTAAIALALSTVTLSTAAQATTTVATVVTGTSPSGTIDPNWSINGGDAYTPADVNDSWRNGIGNTPENGARWLTPTANGNATVAAGDYAFSTTFSLSNIVNLSTASLTGRFWADNRVLSIILNGVAIYTNGSPNHQFLSSFGGQTFGAGAGFNYGNNTLVFNVRNNAPDGGANPMGLLARADVTAAVPEPGAWMLMLMGFGFVGFQMRRRQKTQVRFQFA